MLYGKTKWEDECKAIEGHIIKHEHGGWCGCDDKNGYWIEFKDGGRADKYHPSNLRCRYMELGPD